MNKFVVFIAVCALFLSCNKNDDNPNDNNPFLTAPPVSINLSLNLPEFNPLRFPGNSVIITSRGIRGIVVYNVNNDLYTAFDLTDPNHVPNDCSRMEIDGIIATCPCTNDTNSHDIVTGQHQTDETAFPMQQYNATRNGDVISITN